MIDKVYKTAVIADYFTEDELVKKIGLTKNYWNDVIMKELIDNALDAIEPLNSKEVYIEQNSSSLGIYDNGAGISCETVKSIYDFRYYISKNRHFITASRGKQDKDFPQEQQRPYYMSFSKWE